MAVLFAKNDRSVRAKGAMTPFYNPHQVIPTVARLCSKMRPVSSVQALPLPTEFRWLGILLAALIKGGTVSRRRKLIHHLVRLDNVLGTSDDYGAEWPCFGCDKRTLSCVDEMWIVRVLLPALDDVGWDR